MQKPKLTNLQVELLKLFSMELTEDEFSDLKDILASYFAKKAILSADKAWEENGWSEEYVEQLLNKEQN